MASRLLLLLVFTLVASPAAADSIRILSQNLDRLFDDIDDGMGEKVLASGRYRTKIKTAAKKIGGEFDLPGILALQEVENLNVLADIALEVRNRYGLAYQMVLIPGQDISGINLGYLVHPGLRVLKVESLFADASLDFDGNPLFSRPPLYMEVCYYEKCLALLNLHLRSMRGIDSGKDAARVLAKRHQQANTIAGWVNNYQKDNPAASLMLLGDFNALTPADAYLDTAGIIRGNPDNRQTRIAGKDLLDPDLVDLTLQIPESRRYSYIFRRNKQQLDYMMVNQGFAPRLVSIEFSRIDYRFSDHAGLVADFRW